MPFESYFHILPKESRADMRVCEIPDKLGVPPGKYLLMEFYCNEVACDCRRVVVQFYHDLDQSAAAASISYGWERALYYKKWSRGEGDLWRKMSGAALEPDAEQGPFARRFLELFKHLSKDPTLVSVFRRHYRMVRAKINQSALPDPPGLERLYLGDEPVSGIEPLI